MPNNKYKTFYIDTSVEQLKKLSNLFLAWEKHSKDLYLIEDILRITHSMKGAAATMEYNKTVKVLHLAEDIFYALLHKELELSEKVLDILFKTLQVLDKNIKNIISQGKEANLDIHIKSLKQVIKNNATKTKTKIKKQARASLSYITHSGSDLYTPLEIVVPTDRLDKLQRIVDSLFVAKMNLQCLISHDPDSTKSCLEIDRIVADLRREVKELRTMSLAQIFSPLPRLVRELAKAEKKNVNLIIEDNGLSLDKTILDDMIDIIVQLLRNAMVHGITTKQKDGQIIVQTEIVNDSVKIVVADNGQGIDWQEILAIALKKKIITTAQSKEMKLSDIKQLIFDGHFSSSSTTSIRGGRGVGLSLVQKRVKDLRGSVVVDSSKNKGARFTILLPLPVSVLRSLVFQIGNFYLALPNASVIKIIRLPKLIVFDKQTNFVHKNIKYSLISLAKVLEIKKLSIVTQNLAIIKHDNKKILLPLPQITKEEDIIIKRTPKVLKNNKIVSFVAVAADGRPVLVLNVDYLFD
ncbi:hypothetical protein HOD19_01700 [bacterium]|nr:hypothetical protein [bacterium]